MKDLQELGELKTYLKTRHDDIVKELYTPCLANSIQYTRGAGYFSSSVFSLMSEDLLRFCIDGGKITILTSTELQTKDLAALEEAGEIDNALTEHFMSEIIKMLSGENLLKKPAKMLVALIHSKSLEIKIGVLKGKIYHEKKGYFSDGKGNFVSFDGSGNETRSGIEYWLGNAESFNVSYSWDETDWAKRGNIWMKDLNDTIAGKDFPVETLDSIDPAFLGTWDIEENLESHSQAARERQEKIRKKWVELYGEKYSSPMEEPITNSDTSYSLPDITLRDHQNKGIESWISNSKRGILKHATGSGKTITAISIIKNEIDRGSNVVVMVPGKELLYQWKEEIEKYIPDAIIDLLGDGNKSKILALLKLEREQQKGMIVIAIGDSLSIPRNSFMLENAVQNQVNSLFFVVDECHKIGAPGFSGLTKINFQMTLGLSATPERPNDEDGSKRVFSILGNTVHTYTLKEAFHDRHLSKFNYHIEKGYLNDKEQEKYDGLNKEIVAKLAAKKEGAALDNYTKSLIRQARGIIRSAEDKIEATLRILKEYHGKSDFREYWLIYAADSSMIEKLQKRIKESLKIDSLAYWSGQNRSERKTTLDYFQKGGGVLIAIKCLDEGVDIPSISHGIIIASSKTKREWIQRRGRLLRKSKGKSHSEIFDILTFPSEKNEVSNRFVLHEVERAKEFAECASNYFKFKNEMYNIEDEYETLFTMEEE